MIRFTGTGTRPAGTGQDAIRCKGAGRHRDQNRHQNQTSRTDVDRDQDRDCRDKRPGRHDARQPVAGGRAAATPRRHGLALQQATARNHRTYPELLRGR